MGKEGRVLGETVSLSKGCSESLVGLALGQVLEALPLGVSGRDQHVLDGGAELVRV